MADDRSCGEMMESEAVLAVVESSSLARRLPVHQLIILRNIAFWLKRR